MGGAAQPWRLRTDLVVSVRQDALLEERSDPVRGPVGVLNPGQNPPHLHRGNPPSSPALLLPPGPWFPSHFSGLVRVCSFGMERARDGACSAGMFILGVLTVLWSAPNGVLSFNLYAERPTVYRGPDGSYFGYSVDFYQASSDSNT